MMNRAAIDHERIDNVYRSPSLVFDSLSLTLTPQVTRIDGTVDSPPCLKVTHKTFGTQNSNSDMVYCRLSMPVEFYSADKLLDESLKLRSDISGTLEQQWNCLTVACLTSSNVRLIDLII